MFSLKYKIAAGMFFIQVVMLVFVIWQTLSQSINSNQENISAIETSTLNLIGQSARIALFTEEFDIIQSRVEQLVEDKNILQAFILDHRNIVVASDNLSNLGELPLDTVDTDASYWRKLEIVNQSDRLGMLYVQYSREAVQKTYRAAWQRGLAIGVLGLIFTAIVSLVMGSLLTRRLNKVVRCVDDVTHGNYSARSNISGKDEVARLGVVFDAMLDQVEQERNTMFDINRELERRVKVRTAHLEDAVEENKSFSYSVSHDLRAPLRRVTSYLQILEEDYDEKLDDEGKRIIERILHSNVEMNKTIDSLLELSKLNRKELDKKRIDLSTLVERVVNDIREYDKQRRVEVNVMPGMSIFADADMITRVVENLCHNAWKYTSLTERPEIEFGMRQEGENIYYCKDNGAGFNQEYAGKVFSAFQRLHSEEQFSGSGIGLSTVKKIILRHGGKIWAEGEEGKGATFYFTLPDEGVHHEE